MGGNQLRLRRESPKDTGGDNHRVSTPAYSACAQLVGSSQFRHEEDESEDLCPTEGNLVPKNVCAGGISESFSESRWRQDGPVTRKVTDSQIGIPDTVGHTHVPDPTGISHIAWHPVRLSCE